MNIKDLFNRKKNVEEVQEEVVAINNPDVPTVVFQDIELQTTIGQWLGLLSSSKGYGNSSFSVYTHLDADELLRSRSIPKRIYDEINEKFGTLLKFAGIDKDETCIISDFDKQDFSFNCHLNNSDEDCKISLRWGDFFESGPEFTMNRGNESRTYDYVAESEDTPIGLSLQHWTIKNPENGNSCFRYYSPYSIGFSLSNDNYTLSIDISRPDNNKPVDYNDNFKLKNEEELTQYLLGLSFSLKIDEVYKKICEISVVDSVKDFPNFKVAVEKKEKEKRSEITDRISLNHGQLRDFIITKDGRKIIIDSDGNWSFESPRLNVSQNADGLIHFSLNAIQSSELNSTISPMEQFNKTKKEVDGVKVFVKTILNN